MDDSNDLYLIFGSNLIVLRCYLAILGDNDLNRIYLEVVQDIFDQGFVDFDLFYDPVIENYYHFNLLG